ncbi:MAG: hypothetical protein J1F02_01965 [Lachnospiraceae bacterium]|nr:hypothetical protein [Lachnospiraceae bacterium]
MKKMKRTLVRRIMPAIMSVVLVLTSVQISIPVAAATEPKDSAMDRVLADAIQDGKERAELAEKTGDRSLLWDTSYFNPDSESKQTKTLRRISAASETEVNLPAKYDLRDEGYVTPVKWQNPFGTCWGFATIAAAETSILSEKKMKYDKETNDLDLSELHLAWFSAHALPEDSSTGQGGEGIYPGSETCEGLNAGGATYYGTIAFASGMGPRSERDIPYQPKDPENHIYTVKVTDQNGDPFDLPLMYKADADWSVDESERFGIGGGGYELEESSLLPSPADRTMNEDGEIVYQYNEEGTKAIKKELMEGRAVSIGFSSDQSRPGQELDEGAHLNPDTWAHFTYDVNDEAGHSVTIVGWDDDYAVSNFLEGHQPEGPGAWIVKNSWGSVSNKFPHWYPWGIDGEGYFYLSYYDRSIVVPETFNFFTEGSGYDELYANQYDYMPAEGLDIHASDKKVSEANVFHAEDGDMTLRCVAATTSKAGAKITYEIYKLNDNYTSPTDGTLLETIEKTYEYAGYHRENLKTEQHFRMGEPYSVVVTQESDGRYLYGAASGTSKTSWERLPEETKPYSYYSVGVIHKGESFLGSEDESGGYDWVDWKDFSQKYLAATGNMTTLDNFAIKTYSDPYDGFPPQTTKEPQTTNLSTAEVTLAKTNYTYNGSPKTPDVTVTAAGKTLTKDKDYTVSYKNNTNAGTAAVTVTAKDNSGYTGSKAVTFTIKKASQTLKLKVSKKKYKAKKLKKKKAAFKIKPSKNKTSMTYKVTKGSSKYIRVSKKGVVTMKKGAKKGTYKVTVTAKASTNYKKAKKVVTIIVK